MKFKRNILSVVFIIAAIISICIIIKIFAERKQNQEETSRLQQIAYSEETTKDSNTSVKENNSTNKNSLDENSSSLSNTYDVNQFLNQKVDIDLLQYTNADIFAWIKIPGTDIDYPIVQHPIDDEYYLKHGADGSKSSYGCPYIELCDSTSLDDFNTVIYGHNMNDGSMFAGLHKFEDKDFYDEHRQIFIYTIDHVYTYEIFAAVMYSDDYIPYCYDDTVASQRIEFLESLRTNIVADHSIVSNDISVNEDSNIITLSTCDKVYRDNRYLVVAVRTQIDGNDI